MSLVVGVQFADEGKMYYFDPGDLELEMGDNVLVETARGSEVGQVVLAPQEVEIANTLSPLKKVIKLADEADLPVQERDVEKEQEAFRIAEEKIRKREMPMKLIDVEFSADGSKIIFYFAAEGRVDFRELVKDLASIFKTRIELRQIGVRDEAKKVGGLGPCGRPCCCNAFLEDFVPVSIKMAKEQSLSLSPTKISGLCGRLMCCLHYEQETYHEMRSRLPHVGAKVRTPDGAGEVCEVEVLTGKTKVKVELADGTIEARSYPLSNIRFKKKGAPDSEMEDEPWEEEIIEEAEPKLSWKLEMDEDHPRSDEEHHERRSSKRHDRPRRSSKNTDKQGRPPQKGKGKPSHPRPHGPKPSGKRDRGPRQQQDREHGSTTRQ